MGGDGVTGTWKRLIKGNLDEQDAWAMVADIESSEYARYDCLMYVDRDRRDRKKFAVVGVTRAGNLGGWEHLEKLTELGETWQIDGEEVTQ